MESYESMLETRLVRVRGTVQGMGYRDACVEHARALGISGWVRNRMDGSVEAMLQGSTEQVAEMCEWLEDGMPTALVEEMEIADIAPPFPRFNGFEQLPTV
ncbi:acylphosphatase [Trinickia sp. EG282A]|uniref:acylphosphatase n=1 Tax=Trinickia sp. EG282A TaxID=3237013 RepID=UPI0034D27484